MKKIYWIVITVGILTTILISLASFLSFQDLLKAIEDRRKSFLRKETTLLILSSLENAEASQRGYLLTKNKEYLQSYNDSLRKLEDRLRVFELRQMMLSPDQAALFQELNRLMGLRIHSLNNRIEQFQESGLEVAQRAMMENEGKRLTDNIRLIIDQMVENEDVLLKKAQNRIDHLNHRVFWLNILAGVLPSLLLVLYSYLYYHDALQLRRLKHHFRQTYNLYKAILDNARQIIVTTDTKGNILTFNKGAESLLEYKAEEVINKISILDLYDPGVTKEKAEQLATKSHLTFNGFEVLVAPSRRLIWSDSEWMMRKKNGRLIPCSLSIIALRDEEHEITGYLFLALDLSNYKKWESDIQGAREAIESAQLSKNQFLISFSHDLRVPLNSIVNLSNLLIQNKSGNLKEQELSYVTRILTSCQAMLDMVNTLLEVSREEAGVQKSESINLFLPDLTNQLIGRLAKKFKDIQFIQEIPKEIKSFQADPEKTFDILQHLIKHAAYDLKKGQIIIRVKIHPKTQFPEEVEVIQSVKESSSLNSLSQEGTEPEVGDLIIAQSLASTLGYQIKISSRLGSGAVYSLILHTANKIVPVPRKDFSKEEESLSDSKDFKVQRLNILVLDDDQEFLNLISGYLQSFGCHVVTASSGEEALILAKQYPIDLITMDMLMAPMNGFDVVQQLKRDPDLKNIPFAFISVIAKEMRSKFPGALAFINKPITPDDLVQLLKKYQSQRQLL